MAARTNKIRHDEETRAKIQTSQLINRLEGHVLGEFDLKPTQVTAALGLIKKTLPDLTATEHSGEQTLVGTLELIRRVVVDSRHPDSTLVSPATPAIEV